MLPRDEDRAGRVEPPRLPRRLVPLVILAQALLYCAFAWSGRGQWLYSDHVLYERPAWGLAQGHGYAISRAEWEDPALTRMHFAARPERAGAEWIPAATFPPGYGMFLGAVYSIAGRSQVAAVLANGLLLLATTLLAIRVIGLLRVNRRTYSLAVILIGLWPHSAFWASRMTSDTLHAALMMAFAFAWLGGTSLRRSLAAGGLLAAATLVRPYSVLIPIGLLFLGLVRRPSPFHWRRVAVVALMVYGTAGLWAARNSYQFGRPIVFTSLGAGIGLYVASYQFTEGDTPSWDVIMVDWQRIGVADPYRLEDHARLEAAARARIAANPVGFVRVGVLNVFRRWTPGLGPAPRMLGVGWLVWTHLLLAAMLAGLVIESRRGDLYAHAVILLVLYYSTVFYTAEGRYLLPVRPFGFWLSAVAVDGLMRRWANET